VIADAHLGYSAARQRLGDAVPLRSVAEDMQPLAGAAKLHKIHDLIVAGDLFERGLRVGHSSAISRCAGRMGHRFPRPGPGNHDRGVEQAPIPSRSFRRASIWPAGVSSTAIRRRYRHAPSWDTGILQFDGTPQDAVLLAHDMQLVLPRFHWMRPASMCETIRAGRIGKRSELKA